MTERARSRGVGRVSIGFAILLGLFAAAPTVGDIGSCGKAAEPLDAKLFFEARIDDQCRKCTDCDLATNACLRACDPRTRKALPSTFPPGCHPAVHDGEVCLRALEALSCDAFADVVGDNPIVPTECDFCPSSDAVEGGR